MPVLILLANPTAKQGPLIAEIFISLCPSFFNKIFIFSERVISSSSITAKPFVNKTIEIFFL